MKRVILILAAAAVSALCTSCATTCSSADDVCKEKQSAEYARPFYTPPGFEVPQ